MFTLDNMRALYDSVFSKENLAAYAKAFFGDDHKPEPVLRSKYINPLYLRATHQAHANPNHAEKQTSSVGSSDDKENTGIQNHGGIN